MPVEEEGKKDRQIKPYYFNDSSSSWRLVEEESDVTHNSHFITNNTESNGVACPAVFRVSTFNVLADIFPKPVELVIQSDLRRPYLLQMVEELDATILGLNEVSATILEAILSSPFVRRNYFVSETTTKTSKRNTDLGIPGSTTAVGQRIAPTIGAHGCLLLSKIPFVEVWSVDTLKDDRDNGREVIVGLFKSSDVVSQQGKKDHSSLFAVASQHTQAYQNEVNYLKRKTQIANACAFMKSLLSSKGSSPSRFVLMGDLNMHYLCEDGFVVENDLIDTWAETNFDVETENFPTGYTYDSVSNGMISHYVPGENRQMRLDRILCSPAFLTTFPVRSPCAMWATEAINAARDIWPSDHYGLTIDLCCTTAAVGEKSSSTPPPTFTPNPVVRKLLEENAKIPREKPTYNLWRFAGALPYHLWFLGKRLANY